MRLQILYPTTKKGESSLSIKGKSVNYIYDTTILCISEVEKNNVIDNYTDTISINDTVSLNVIPNINTSDNQINVIKIRETQDYQPVNATTRGQSKVILKGVSFKITTPPSHQYNIMDQLQKIPAQISILELLKISPSHKEVLEQALVATTIANNLDVHQFQAMVGHLTTPHYLSFSEQDDVSLITHTMRPYI